MQFKEEKGYFSLQSQRDESTLVRKYLSKQQVSWMEQEPKRSHL